MAFYPGVPAYLKVYEVVSPRIVVAIYEQGDGPHPGPLDRLYLYIKMEDFYTCMGELLSIPPRLDLKAWATKSIENRLKTRFAALDRLQRDLAKTEAEIKALKEASK